MERKKERPRRERERNCYIVHENYLSRERKKKLRVACSRIMPVDSPLLSLCVCLSLLAYRRRLIDRSYNALPDNASCFIHDYDDLSSRPREKESVCMSCFCWMGFIRATLYDDFGRDSRVSISLIESFFLSCAGPFWFWVGVRVNRGVVVRVCWG